MTHIRFTDLYTSYFIIQTSTQSTLLLHYTICESQLPNTLVQNHIYLYYIILTFHLIYNVYQSYTVASVRLFFGKAEFYVLLITVVE